MLLFPFTTRISTDEMTALPFPQHAHVRLPCLHKNAHHAQNITHKRHTMRIQTIYSRVLAIYNTVHALGGLDL